MKTLLLTVIALLSCLHPVHAEYAGRDAMKIVGKGEIRYLGFIRIYTATLLVQGDKSGWEILQQTSSKCLELHYFTSLTAEEIVEGTDIILSRQHSAAKLASVKTELDTFHDALVNVKKNDRYLLCYDAARRQTTIYFNDSGLATVTSAEFGELYFGIWLGPTAPINDTLRDQLLGKTQ